MPINILTMMWFELMGEHHQDEFTKRFKYARGAGQISRLTKGSRPLRWSGDTGTIKEYQQLAREVILMCCITLRFQDQLLLLDSLWVGQIQRKLVFLRPYNLDGETGMNR